MRFHLRRSFSIVSMMLLLPSLGGCIVTPRIEMVDRIDFNYHPPAIPQQMDVADILCCTHCEAQTNS